ncbi:MAG: helix-turn-helix domain-containing protein [Alphaproteobacteria bacterium]
MLKSVNIAQANKINSFNTQVGLFAAQFFEGDSEVPHHHHADPYISFVQAGNYLEKSQKAEIFCEKNAVIIHPANDAHSNLFHSDCVVLSLFFKTAELEHLRPNAMDFGGQTFKTSNFKILFHKISEELRVKDQYSDLVLEGLALEVLGEIMRNNIGQKASRNENIVQKALEILHDQNEGMVTLSELETELSVQKSVIARSFKRATGYSIGEYLRKLKIKEASRLLQETDLPICQVALKVGFCDQAHMNRVFKRETQTTPLNYRKRFRAN